MRGIEERGGAIDIQRALARAEMGRTVEAFKRDEVRADREQQAREDNVRHLVMSEMVAEDSSIERDGDMLVFHGNYGRKYLLEVKVFELDKGGDPR